MIETCRFVRTIPTEIIREEAVQVSQEISDVRVKVADVMSFLFRPARYKVAYGGRGGVKSWSFARALLILGAQNKLRILCAREFQNSIKDSVHQLLQDQIHLMGLKDYYQVFNTEIKGITGTEIVFTGLKNNVNRIKSMEGIDICWVEEAEKVSENSWMVLIPTIRKEGSEIWVSFNPHQETDPTYKRFITNPPPAKTSDGQDYCIVIETGWKDNPWLPEGLKVEKDYLARVDKDAYDHVWGGEIQKKSNSQVMHGKCELDTFEPDLTLCECGHRIDKHTERSGESIPCKVCGCKEFREAWKGPYYGADWGFSTDPSVLIKKWIFGENLYIEKEFWKVGVEINDLPKEFLRVIPEVKNKVIRADNSRPETISYLKNWKDKDESQPFSRIIAAEKWPGSVEDGIAFMRKFGKVVIHATNCLHTAEESRTYKHKVDPLTGDVLTDIIDKNNHCWDSVRYGLEPLIKRKGLPGLFFIGTESKGSPIHRYDQGGSMVKGDGGLSDSRALAWFRGE